MPNSDNIGTLGHNLNFWTKPQGTFPKAFDILHSGFLYSQDTLSSDLVPRLYALTSTNLVQVQWWTDNQVEFLEGKVGWATVESFEERDEEQTRFGFSLRCGDWGSDFYVADQRQLDQWLEKLAQVAILRGLKEDYEIQREIGRGGQSVVYLAQEKSNGGKVCIKSYQKQQLSKSPKHMNSLINEIDILRNTSHPNLIKLHRVYETPSSIDLVTDYYEGQLLSTALSTPFTEAEALEFMINLMDILQYLESEQVAHRDIKPANIILINPTNRAEFKLIDFGLSQRCVGSELSDTSGSPGYFAPEVLQRRSHGIKADIYAAGIVFYTLITGSNPFLSSSLSESLRLNRENDIAFSSQVWEIISPSVVSIIRVMTNFNPALRMNPRDLHTWLLHTSSPAHTVRKLGLCSFHSADEVRKTKLGFGLSGNRGRRSSLVEIRL